MKNINEPNLLIIIAISWFIYSLSIISMSSCNLFMKESKGNEWNLYYTNVEGETGEEYDVFHDGPVSITEAKEIINDCQNKAQSFRKKYGTVFNYENSQLKYSFLIDLLILLLPLIFLYHLYMRWSNKFLDN